MTKEQALAFLELAADADAVSVRRAYVRLLRRYKPEVDPDGFRQLREAYELLGSHFGAGPRGPVARELVPEPSTPDSSEAPSDDLPSAEPLFARELAIEVDPRAQVFFDRVRDLQPHTYERERGVLIEGVAACPDSVHLRLALANVHEELGGIWAAVAVLRDGAARGLSECIWELLVISPESLEPEWLAREAEALPALLVAQGYAAGTQPQRAAEIVRVALAPENWGLPWIQHDLVAALRVALQMMASGEGDLARAMWGEIRHAAESSGTELEAADLVPVLWQVGGQLLQLDPPMPRELEMRTAAALVGGTRPDLRTGTRANVSAATRVALNAQLHREAPELARFVEIAGPERGFTWNQIRWFFFVVFLLNSFGGLHRCRSHEPSRPSSDQSERRHHDHPPPVRAARDDAAANVGDQAVWPASEASIARAREAMEALCARTDGAECARARAIVSGSEHGDCVEVLAPDPRSGRRRSSAFVDSGLPLALRRLAGACREASGGEGAR